MAISKIAKFVFLILKVGKKEILLKKKRLKIYNFIS